MRFSQSGREILKEMEGVIPRVYDDLATSSEKRKGLVDCYSAQGTPTIGIGHVVYASWKNECEKYANHFRDGYDLPLDQILAIFEEDIAKRENILNKKLTVKLSQKQYDALFLMMFNTGSGNSSFKKAVEFANQKKWAETADAIAGGPVSSKGVELAGLKKRRLFEAQMFLDGSKSTSPNALILLGVASLGLYLFMRRS